MSPPKRAFLFLQGPCSLLFARLADQLTAHGHTVHKVNFNCGDFVYWSPRPSSQFRGSIQNLADFLREIWLKHSITDQVLFGDCRPVHQNTAQQSTQFGIRTHVVEGGYFRPLWITIEPQGVNANSMLPRDPRWFRAVGANLPEPDAPVVFRPSFFDQALHDVVYHAAGLANPLLYPGYRRHLAESVTLEYLFYLRRLALLKSTQKRENQTIQQLIADGTKYYLFPLQLNNDAQIQYHSAFKNILEAAECVLRSFAKNAPADTKLVIKNHPLDMGLIDYRAHIGRLASTYDLIGRIIYLESGNINPMISTSLGLLTINSTSGIHSLELGRPTLTLADPIYHLPGLTFQGELDDFWCNPEPPDPHLFQDFRKVVITTTQVNGSLYCAFGTKLAAQNALKLLEAEQSPLEKLLVS